MRQLAITLMAVTMAFTVSAQALAPPWADGGYGMSWDVAYQQLPDDTWEYRYDLYAEGDNVYYDYFTMKFEFGNDGKVTDHVTNLYDPGSGIPELREFWAVNGMLGNNGGHWFYGAAENGVQASWGDLDTNTWFTNPTPAQAVNEQYGYPAKWFIDPVYAVAEGMANPFYDPSDYARWAHNGGTLGDAALGLRAGQPGDLTIYGGVYYTPLDTHLMFDVDWQSGGHMYGGYYGPELMATFRIVSDMAPYGSVSAQFYSSGTSGIGEIIAPGAPTGDVDFDGDVDDIDIDAMGDAIRTGSTDFGIFDISADGVTAGQDGVIDINDLDFLVRFLVETSIGNGTEYGDFNLDGKVDTTDLTRLATNYGDDNWKWDDGNANRNIDTNIDNTDLTILATYYGFGMPDVVPEPATLSLLALGASGLLRRRRRA